MNFLIKIEHLFNMHYIYLCLIGILIIPIKIKAQQRDYQKDTIKGIEEVDIVKTYQPTVSEAQKIKSVPSLNDSLTTTTRAIEYTIYSVPVASTFTPSKGRATVLKKAPKELLYNSYLSLGYGNYHNALLDFYTSKTITRDQQFDLLLNHHSSQGGIDEVVLDDFFYDTSLEAHYRKQERFMTWGFNGGVQHQIYNWYGLPIYNKNDVEIDSQQTYYAAKLGGEISMDDAYFTDGTLKYRRFWDATESYENHGVFTSNFLFPLGNDAIRLKTVADYVDGKFESAYLDDQNREIKYSNLIGGMTPVFETEVDKLSLKIGGALYYNQDFEQNKGDLFVYPNVNAAYTFNEQFIVYAGVTGALEQNTYYNFAQTTPYITPTINIRPTDNIYTAFTGVSGNLLPTLTYQAKVAYGVENNKPLYSSTDKYNALIHSPYTPYTGLQREGYEYGNAIEIVYDDVKTLSVFGQLNFEINNAFNLAFNAEFLNYTTDKQEKAWNLPIIKSAFLADYTCEKWTFSFKTFYQGERKDLISDFTTAKPAVVITDLKAYFDVNTRIDYKITDRWSAFIQANNIVGDNYQRYVNYPVQGFQLLGGLAYKFDL